MAELIPDQEPQAGLPRSGPVALFAKIVTWWGIFGGLVFSVLVLMSIVSIVGRKLFSAPIEGDMELLMMGAAVGSAAFLAVCELEDHHIKVDALTTWMSVQARAVLDTLAHALLMIASAVLTWRTALYVEESFQNTEVSPLMLIPVWQPVALMVPSFVLLTLAAAYRVMVSLDIARGRP